MGTARNSQANIFFLFYIYGSVPVETNRPLVFYPLLFLQCLSGTSYMLMVSLFSGLYIGMCTYITTCMTDLPTFVDQINNHVKSSKRPINHRKIDELSAEMLSFHINILQ